MAAPEDLFSKRLIVVAGKGGVGRTTVAAALGVMLAGRGRRVLLVQASAKEKLSQLLAGPVIGEEITPLREGLWAVNTNPSAALHEYGLMVLRYEAIYRMVFENKVAKALLRAIPGLDDYSIVGKVWWHATQELDERREPVWDTVIFDAPATGHAVTMLGIPRAILDAVPEGPLTRDAVKVRELLEDPERTATVLVTLAEEMPVNEAIELAGRLRGGLGMSIPWLVVNQLYPDRGRAGVSMRLLDCVAPPGGRVDDPVLAPLIARARTIRARREINDRYLTRLERELDVPHLELPLLFVPALGPAEVEQLAGTLEGQLVSREMALREKEKP